MDALSRLQRLYASLPRVACRGLCGHSCVSRIDASDVEREVAAQRGVDFSRTADGVDCPALSRNLVPTGSCTIHQVRPMVCRIWGVAEAMPCPHGCAVEARMSDREVLAVIERSYAIGGHADTVPLELVHKALDDPATAALMARMLRGERSARAPLAAALAGCDLS